jgi:hypothetical protein
MPAKSPPTRDDANPTGTYILILVVEVVVIAGLYWVGRTFS